MAKLFVAQSSCIFAVTIFALLILSVGLLVFVLKGQIHHENSLTAKDGHAKVSPLDSKGSTHTPSPQTAPKALATRSTDGQVDVGLTTESSEPDPNPWEDFRLPKYIVPLHYDLLLHPNIPNDTFTGTVNITVNVTKDTNYFIVHAYKLSIKDSKIFGYRSDLEIGVAKAFLYDPHEYYVIEAEKTIEPDIYKLSYSFSGSLVGSIVGFYKSRYTDRNNETSMKAESECRCILKEIGNKDILNNGAAIVFYPALTPQRLAQNRLCPSRFRYLATSKFQPTYARRAFPCYDEPSFKSTFTVSLVHEPNYIALSNMPVDETTAYLDTQLLITRFQTSVPMVTYLACFIVCDFSYTRNTTSAGKEFRVYSAPDQINKTDYALKFGTRVLEYFENYFEIDYPLPKQDMVAVPDFVSGAMEHWGVITFRESNLLSDVENTSPQNKQRISTVISHEMAHMWFGNLVTMEWWDDLWLNEGFASFVEYKGVQEQHPEWDMISQYVTEDVQPVMDLDSTMNSHPIVQPVTHPDEITEIFDDISYSKGASVIRMLEFFVGKNNFRRGISKFLKKYQFKNAKTADLWAELSEACGYQGNHTIASVMKTWTEQMGFPFITVKRSQSNQNESTFVANQRRFVKNQDLYRQYWNSSKEYIWSVPLSYVTENGQSDIIWIHDEKEMEFTVPLKETEWIKFNVNQTGYYLVNYEQEEWNRLIEVLMTNHEVLSPSDRSSLLYDSFLLAEAGHIPFDIFLTMSMYLKNETHLIPWETAYHSFVFLCQLLEYTEVNFLLKSYVNDLTNGLYKKLGWKIADNHLDNLLKTTITGLACHTGNRDCLSDAAQLFQDWTQGQEIPSSFRSLVYHYGMSEIGQEEHWNYMWNKYITENAPSERKTLLYGLAHVRVPSLLHRYLGYAMDDKKIRKQDFFTVLNFIAGNPVGRPLVWNFLRDNWTALVEKFTLNDRYLGLAVKKICSYFTTDHELQQMKAFFLEYPDAGAGKRRRQQALENVQNNIKWLKTFKNSVKTWLEFEGTSPWYNHRLPTYIIPEHYDLMFYPLLDGDIFVGTTTITVVLEKPSDCFLVHAVNLNVSKSEIRFLGDDSLVEIEETFRYDDNDYLVLKTGQKLPLGRYKLYFEYEGPFTVSLKGLYKSTYVNPQTKERRSLAVTQFAPADARRAFPCLDEPSFRSTFTVHVIHDSDHYALSNAVVEEVVPLKDELYETKFEKTLSMSTYLVCIVVSDFKHKSVTTENNVKLSVYAPPHLIDKADYALEIGSKILTHYEKYFDVSFPLKKLDMIAIPDMNYGAMENWGLITYSEDNLLYDNQTSLSSKFYAVKTIAHELAHMWFGNLVGTIWWDDVWLKEGFATYISLEGIRHVEPEFDSENALFSLVLHDAMVHDQTVNSHPIVQRIIIVNEDIYDPIAYQKGASVLGMLENYMHDDFRKGVSAYLKKYAYSNARTEDLWTELTAASTQNLNVSLIMDTWIKQMNYPYITISKRPHENGLYNIQQRRYLEDPSTMIYSTNLSPYNYIWQIPITYRTSDNNEAQNLLLNSSDTVTLNFPGSKWIKFNVNFTGYYAVNYEAADWKQFVDILKSNHEEFTTSDRVNLLFDSFSLASAGVLDYDIPLAMTGYLKNETFYGVWKIAMNNLEQLKRYFRNDRVTKDIIKEHIRSLTKKLLRKYTWQIEGNYSEKQMRVLLIKTACSNGHHECLVTAGNLFNQWRRGLELNPEIRGLVLTHGLRVLNDEESWDFVFQKYLSATNPDETSDLQEALALVKNSAQIEMFIEAAKNESIVRKHDYFRVLQTIAENRGFPQVTSLIFNNWTDLVRTHGGHKTEVFAYKIFKLYDTEKDLKKVRDFYRKHKVAKDGQRSRTLAIESILENIRWQEMHKISVKRWFENNVYMPWKNSRLPRHILPSKYDITIHPNITQLDFEGSEVIAITISEPTDYVLFHELALKISNVDLMRVETMENMVIDETFPYKKNSYIVILFKEMIPAGEYLLKINFTGVIEERGDGLGRYPYYTQDAELRYMLASKFEPIDARKMFPCFDEPDMKAKFKLTVIHEDNYTAISNMPVETITPVSDNKVKTTFQESVIMSTYLLCCVVSGFDYIESEYKGKKVRAYAPPDKLENAEHGLNITIKVLEKFEEYFDIPYVLPKLDSVAIPIYKVPAMEHWGIITYQDRNFLIDSESTLYSRMLRIDRVISHELAHQWFGNLVTMKWWNDLWLNEGFATLIMYMPLTDYYPAAEELEVRKISRMMCTDSTMDSRPIIENVSNMADISELFDQIRYEKGSAVMRMLKYTLKDDFRKGLSNYLKKYAFKNAETKDLWEELSSASSMDLNITQMMKTWTLQMGFPYIELKRNEDTLSATQRWFLRKKNDTVATLLALTEKVSPFGFVWKIPLIYKNINTGNEYTLWLNERNATFRINAMKDDIVKFNPNFVGYYIVKYDEDDYSRLARRLQENHTIFSAIDRYNLLYDAFLLAESDRLLYDVPLEFTKYLKNEKELMPWMLFRDKFSHFLSVMDGNSETIKLLKEYARRLTDELYNDVVSSKNDSSHLKRWESSMLSSSCALTWVDIDLTETITDLACRSGNEKCIKSLSDELDLWLRGENITAHIYLVLGQAIPYYGNQTIWNILYDRLIAPDATDEEKSKVVFGLVSFTGRTEIMNTIEIMANDPAVNSDLARVMFERLGSNPHAAPALWNYAKSNWKSLLIRFDGEKNLSSAITLFCQTFKTTRDLGGFIKFLKSIPQVNDYILESCITDIQETISWSEKYEATIQSWLRWNTS